MRYRMLVGVGLQLFQQLTGCSCFPSASCPVLAHSCCRRSINAVFYYAPTIFTDLHVSALSATAVTGSSCCCQFRACITPLLLQAW